MKIRCGESMTGLDVVHATSETAMVAKYQCEYFNKRSYNSLVVERDLNSSIRISYLNIFVLFI